MLWLSQVLSAIGDQLHSLAVIWISIQIGGAKAGFVAAAGTTAGIVVGLFAGVYADRWNRRSAMIAVDALRAVAVLVLAVVAQSGQLQLWQMAVVAVVVSALGSLFNPCMTASLPALVSQPENLRAITALMIMTFRIARLVGPGIAAVVLAYLPISAFFVIDSASYVVSALAIWSLGTKYMWRPQQASTAAGVRGIMLDLSLSARLVAKNPQLAFNLSLCLFEPGLWCAAYLVGLPLMIKHAAFGSSDTSVTAYATIICAYGFGNVSSLVALGTRVLHKRAGFFSGVGITIMGVGFLFLSFAPNLFLACIAAAFAAAGGPIADLAMTQLLQHFPDEYRGKLNSLRFFLSGLGAAVGLGTAPFLFATVNSTAGVAICARCMLSLGLIGMAFGPAFDRHRQLRTVDGVGFILEPEA